MLASSMGTDERGRNTYWDKHDARRNAVRFDDRDFDTNRIANRHLIQRDRDGDLCAYPNRCYHCDIKRDANAASDEHPDPDADKPA